MSDSVLVPVDDSEPARKALDFAVEKYPDATITALHVVNPRDVPVPQGIEAPAANYDEVVEMQKNRADDLLEEVREDAQERGVDIETTRVVGEVARSIVEYVEGNDVDHVVIGSHGREGTSRILLGSVAERVTRRSPVPVTVVR